MSIKYGIPDKVHNLVLKGEAHSYINVFSLSPTGNSGPELHKKVCNISTLLLGFLQQLPHNR